MPAHLYIDGYNFYYGVTDHFRKERSLRGYSLSGLCWCDFRALIERHFLKSGETLGPIRYFTAQVDSETAANNQECFNQHLWLSAVQSIPGLQVVYGYHQKPDTNKVREEKQTDVNLVVEMLLDSAQRQRPSRVYILSGDADYMPAILALEERLPQRCPVTVLLPPCSNLHSYAERYRRSHCELRRRCPDVHSSAPLDIRQLSESVLANSLLPYTNCPPYWRLPESYLTDQLTDLRYHPGSQLSAKG